MIRRTILLITAITLIAPTSPLLAEEPVKTAQSDTYRQLVESGLRDLYTLDYEGARKNFTELSKQFPDNPIGDYALCTALWWELTNEFDENNASLEKQFLDSADKTIRVCEKMLKKNKDPDGTIHLCLGGALGLKSRWEAIQGHWLKAYRHGKQAFNEQEEAIHINAGLSDAYLGVGIFHYYTATLPAVVKVLAKLMFGGNKQQGLDEINLAMNKGLFSRTAAKLFLIGIYNNTEKDYVKAAQLVKEGRQEFPKSPFFHFLDMLTLENAGNWEALRTESREFLGKIDRGEPFYRTKYAHRAYFSLGNSYLVEGQPEQALSIYNKIIAEFPFEDRWISLTYLNRGKAYDLLGQREKARQDYRTVLKQRDVWQLHEMAEKNIDKPYRQDAKPAK